MLSNTLLGFGVFAVIAAITGGGLRAAGFQVGVLKSTQRQVLLAAVGLVLIASAEWTSLKPIIFPTRFAVIKDGPIRLGTGEGHTIPLSLERPGPVDVKLDTLTPDWNGYTGQRGMPGQDCLYVTICSSLAGGPCSNRQVASSQTFRQVLPEGPAQITVNNFAGSPPMTLSVSVTYPK